MKYGNDWPLYALKEPSTLADGILWLSYCLLDGSWWIFFSTKDFKRFNEDKDAYWQSWWMMRLDEGCILIYLRMSQICNGWKLKWTQLWGRRNNGVTIAPLLYQSSLDLQAVTRRSWWIHTTLENESSSPKDALNILGFSPFIFNKLEAFREALNGFRRCQELGQDLSSIFDKAQRLLKSHLRGRKEKKHLSRKRWSDFEQG